MCRLAEVSLCSRELSITKYIDSTSMLGYMSSDDAARYADFMQNGSKQGLKDIELYGVNKVDDCLVLNKVNYDEVLKLRNKTGVESGTSTKPNQVHHYATDKNKTYTQAFRNIADKYGLDLDADWNKELLPHQGRHPNAYHDFVLDEMRNIDNIANGNKDIFLELYEIEIKSVIRENPDMLYLDYWKGLKE